MWININDSNLYTLSIFINQVIRGAERKLHEKYINTWHTVNFIPVL